MKTPHLFFATVWFLVVTTLALEPGFAESFSVDLASPSVPGVSNSDVLDPAIPGVGIPAAALGLAGGAIDELDALTTGTGAAWLVPDFFFFSVDRASVGIAGVAPDVASEAAVGQGAGDVYSTFLDFTNTLDANQDTLGEIPLIPVGVVAAGAIDNLDALNHYSSLPSILFSLTTGHPYAGTAIGCGGDLFAPGPALVVSYLALGLLACSDDVDALQLDSMTGDIYFSLAPGSISLGPVPPSPIIGCGAGCSPADIFLAAGGVAPLTVVAPSATLGLLPTDNVDALAFSAIVDLPALGRPMIVVLIVTLIATASIVMGSTWRQRAAAR